jgi:ABC-type polysaccharide/polyol phosphate transport system ATPase subunit
MICFQNVSKFYARHAGRKFLRRFVSDWMGSSRLTRFCALKDVSFRIEPGESVAIVGPNGAGKSTLLSLAAGLCPPDEGRVSVRGRVEGFHPDLTGEENVRVNAALLGLSRQDTIRRFDRIVGFSGIGDFIDEPLRTYSTGMVMRLAFAVAVHVRSDILLIDEVLAVGDSGFQTKCVQSILEFKLAGKTLLCVAHGQEILKQICDSALYLDGGHLIHQGPVQETLQAYAVATGGFAHWVWPGRQHP